MIIEATAPTRIDLAGGILDIYPLYLFEEGGITLNAAINLRTIVRIKARTDSCVRIYSEDLKEKREAASIAELQTGGSLDLVARILKFYPYKHGLDVVINSNVPAGSGLGASSSLLIALSGALNHLLGEKYSKDDLIQLGSRLEAQSIRMPTGKQDYYAAAFGGINCIWFGIDHPKVEPLELPPAILEQLSQRLILSYTGEARASATSNWSIIKKYIDNVGSAVRQMKAIKAAALAMRDVLLKGDLKTFGVLLAEDWRNHKSLADGVTTPRIERIIGEAEKAGALASKICGSGGGGCMVTLVHEGCRGQVETALRQAGAAVLDYAIDMTGVRIRKSR